MQRSSIFSLILLAAPLGPGLQGADAVGYQFQLRASAAGGDLKPLVASNYGGGAGFMARFGGEELQVRLRLDADDFTERGEQGRLRSYGLGADLFLDLGHVQETHFYVAAGPALQQWNREHFLRNGNLGTDKTFKGAVRIEAGVTLARHLGLCAGFLAGPLDRRELAQIHYVAFNLHF